MGGREGKRKGGREGGREGGGSRRKNWLEEEWINVYVKSINAPSKHPSQPFPFLPHFQR